MVIEKGLNNNSETTIKIKAWALILVFLGIFGFFFVTVLAHEGRISKTEATLENVVKEIRTDIRDLKNMHMKP